MTAGEIGSAVLPYLATEGVSSAPWWVVLGVSGVVAVIFWMVLR